LKYVDVLLDMAVMVIRAALVWWGNSSQTQAMLIASFVIVTLALPAAFSQTAPTHHQVHAILVMRAQPMMAVMVLVVSSALRVSSRLPVEM
jgi:hypothetical protein